jgi:hypothetical protein
MLLKSSFAVLAYVAPSMLLAVPWHLHWFKQEYQDFGIYTRADPIIPLGLATMLIQGVVLALIYPRWYRGGAPAAAGIRFGLLLGLYLYSVATLATLAKAEVSDPWRFILLSGVFHAIQFTVAGAGIGLVFGRLAVSAQNDSPRSAG